MAAHRPYDPFPAWRTRLADFAIVLGLNHQQMRAAKTIVLEGAQRWLVINIGSSQSLLKIKRHHVASTGVGSGVSPANGEIILLNYAAIFLFFWVEAVLKNCLETAKRIMCCFGILIKAIGKVVVDVKSGQDPLVWPKENLFVKKCRLGREPWGSCFSI